MPFYHQAPQLTLRRFTDVRLVPPGGLSDRLDYRCLLLRRSGGFIKPIRPLLVLSAIRARATRKCHPVLFNMCEEPYGAVYGRGPFSGWTKANIQRCSRSTECALREHLRRRCKLLAQLIEHKRSGSSACRFGLSHCYNALPDRGTLPVMTWPAFRGLTVLVSNDESGHNVANRRF